MTTVTYDLVHDIWSPGTSQITHVSGEAFSDVEDALVRNSLVWTNVVVFRREYDPASGDLRGVSAYTPPTAPHGMGIRACGVRFAVKRKAGGWGRPSEVKPSRVAADGEPLEWAYEIRLLGDDCCLAGQMTQVLPTERDPCGLFDVRLYWLQAGQPGGYSTSGVVHHGSAPYGAVDPDIAVGLALLDLEAKGCPVRKLFQAYNIKIPEGVYP